MTEPDDIVVLRALLEQLRAATDVVARQAAMMYLHLRAVITIVDRVGGYMAPEHQLVLRIAKQVLEEFRAIVEAE